MPTLAAIILTKNEARHVAECVASLRWADRIIVFDSCSDDETVDLARAAGAEVYQQPFANYAAQRNAALDAAAAHGAVEWVFFVDADERGTPQLAAEIRRVIAERPENGWYVPRHNYIFGCLTLGAGWYPDYQFRLLRHGKARYVRPVHELGEVDGAIGYLTNPLIHHNYRDTAQFHVKQRFYVATDAAILKEQGIRPKPRNYVLQPLRQFWWRFVTLRGWRDGWHGLRLSLYMAYYEWRKYRRLAEILKIEEINTDRTRI
jgi:glycosyltransferase involved in cell wall biosynthesis